MYMQHRMQIACHRKGREKVFARYSLPQMARAIGAVMQSTLPRVTKFAAVERGLEEAVSRPVSRIQAEPISRAILRRAKGWRRDRLAGAADAGTV